MGVVNPNPSVTAAGATTPSDAFTNPTTAETVWSLGALWDASTSKWVRAQGRAGIGWTEGAVASGATDSGNPLKVGGPYNSTPPTVTTGQRVDWQMGSRGIGMVATGVLANVGDGSSTGTTDIRLHDRDNNGGVLVVRPYAYAPTGTTAVWDRPRTPTIFKTAVVTATGDTALWTPTSGKKFRVLGYVFYVSANVTIAGGGLVEVLLRDSTTATGLGYSFFAPGAALATFAPSGESAAVQLGNGVLSAAANNVLNVNLSAALATGELRAVAWGTEE